MGEAGDVVISRPLKAFKSINGQAQQLAAAIAWGGAGGTGVQAGMAWGASRHGLGDQVVRVHWYVCVRAHMCGGGWGGVVWGGCGVCVCVWGGTDGAHRGDHGGRQPPPPLALPHVLHPRVRRHRERPLLDPPGHRGGLAGEEGARAPPPAPPRGRRRVGMLRLLVGPGPPARAARCAGGGSGAVAVLAAGPAARGRLLALGLRGAGMLGFRVAGFQGFYGFQGFRVFGLRGRRHGGTQARDGGAGRLLGSACAKVLAHISFQSIHIKTDYFLFHRKMAICVVGVVIRGAQELIALSRCRHTVGLQILLPSKYLTGKVTSFQGFPKTFTGANTSFQDFPKTFTPQNGLLHGLRLGSASHPSSHLIIVQPPTPPTRPGPYPPTRMPVTSRVHHHHQVSPPR